MKKVLVIMGLLLLATAIFGQTSLYEISFGDSVAAVDANLKARGFILTSRSESYIDYSGDSTSALPQIKLAIDSDSGTVMSWVITYDMSQDTEMYKSIIESLTALHGAHSVFMDYDYDYIWYFPEDKALYIYVIAESMLTLDYAPGNWDDDDFYYYYFEY